MIEKPSVMIRIKNLILTIVSLAVIASFSCGDDEPDTPDPLTPEEQRLLDLGGSSGVTWVATSITQDGAPASGLENFSLTLRGTETSKTYSSTDASPFLSSTGTWDFNNGNIGQLVFDGDSDNVYAISNLNTEATPATVTLTVNYTNPSGGVAAGQNGTYVFNLQAQ